MSGKAAKGGDMKRSCLSSLKQFQVILERRSRRILLCVLFLAAVALATPPFGIILNQIVAKGAALENIHQQALVASTTAGSPDIEGETGEDEPWQLQLQSQGATDFYVQQLIVGPGGYSGWHTHPGILIGTVVSGSIDFYDAHCQKHSFTTGQVFMENTKVHGIINTGLINAELSIAYLVKHNAPRRIEADAPACAVSTGIR